MAIKWHPQFAKGSYRAVVDSLLEGKNSTLEKGKFNQLPSLIGSLSFIGRHEDAVSLYEIYKDKIQSPEERAAILYFLSLSYSRLSDYSTAEKTIKEISGFSSNSPYEEFFYHLGLAAILFYTGRLSSCLVEAQVARKASLQTKDLFMKILATDTLGHTYVRIGQVHNGLALLIEGEELAKKIGNIGVANGMAMAREIYESEFGVNHSLENLEKRATATGTEHNFAAGVIALELARQYLLRGSFAKASEVLEAAAPGIYATKNRRQEIKLNQRLAEIALRKGDRFSARHFLWFSDRVRIQELDLEFEIINLGIEWKIAKLENKKTDIERIEKRWKELSAEFYFSRDMNLRSRVFDQKLEKENREDLIHNALVESKSETVLSEKIRILLKKDLMVFVGDALQLDPGEESITILPQELGIVVSNKSGIKYGSSALSSLQKKIIQQFKFQKELSKEELITRVWGYKYNPLRHDSVIYAAISALRKNIGDASDWLVATDGAKYQFKAKIRFAENESAPEKRDEIIRVESGDTNYAELNFRQLEIVTWIKNKKFLTVKNCMDKFRVSEATALRDLRDLSARNYLRKAGMARATRYFACSQKFG